MDSLTLAGGVDQSLITAGLQRFRGELYRCLGRRRDALFELVDALLAAGAMPSLPHLSLVPTHRRGWGTVYAALAAGEVDAARLAEPLIAHRGGDRAPVFGWTPAPGSAVMPSARRGGGSTTRDSWITPLDVRRLASGEDLGQITAAEI